MQAILRAGHIPAGMELFAAGDKSQWETIQRWIDDCDVFLLLLGERYGSIEPDSGKSYIQLEYEYATERGKRPFALVLDEKWIKTKYKKLGSDASDNHRNEHAEFKSLVLSKIGAFVADPKDIDNAVLSTLKDYDHDESLSGWIKGSDLVESQRMVDELKKTIQSLQSPTQVILPTALDIQKDLDRLVNEFQKQYFSRRTELKLEGDVSAKTYELKASGLGLLWRNRGLVRSGKIPRPADEWTIDLVDWVIPHMEMWGLLTPHARGFRLTAKGGMLMSKVDALNQEEAGSPHYAPLKGNVE